MGDGSGCSHKWESAFRGVQLLAEASLAVSNGVTKEERATIVSLRPKVIKVFNARHQNDPLFKRFKLETEVNTKRDAMELSGRTHVDAPTLIRRMEEYAATA